jgi:hypothetical protein
VPPVDRVGRFGLRVRRLHPTFWFLFEVIVRLTIFDSERIVKCGLGQGEISRRFANARLGVIPRVGTVPNTLRKQLQKRVRAIFVTSLGRLKIRVFVTLENPAEHSSLQMFWTKIRRLRCETCEGSPLLTTQIPSPRNDED